MKINTILSLTLSLVVLLFSGCNKSDENPQSDGEKVLKMKINGELWEATKNVTASAAFINDSGDGIIISGRTENGAFFQITTGREITGTGTYNVPGTKGGGLQFDNGEGKTYVEKSLTVTITKIHEVGNSKYVEGAFVGTAENVIDETDVITITEGVFDGVE